MFSNLRASVHFHGCVPDWLSFDGEIHRLCRGGLGYCPRQLVYCTLIRQRRKSPMLASILIAWGSVSVGFLLGVIWFGMCAHGD